MEDDKKKEIEITVTIEDEKKDCHPFNSEEERRDYERLKERQDTWVSFAAVCWGVMLVAALADHIVLSYAAGIASLPFFCVGMYYLCKLQSRYGWPYPF